MFDMDWLLNDPRKQPMPESYKGVWPELLIEGISYHEAGHTISAVHHGLIISEAWVGDGRFNGGVHGEDPRVHGAMLSMSGARRPHSLEQRLTFMLSEIYAAVGSALSEKFAPRFAEFGDIGKKFPEFYTFSPPGTSNFFDGSLGDTKRAFQDTIPFYALSGASPFENLKKMFESDFINPTGAIMHHHEDQVHALAKELIDKRWMSGRDIMNLLCKSGGHRMPGCTHEGKIDEKIDKALDDVLATAAKYRDRAKFGPPIGSDSIFGGGFGNPFGGGLFSPPNGMRRREKVGNEVLAQTFQLGCW